MIMKKGFCFSIRIYDIVDWDPQENRTEILKGISSQSLYRSDREGKFMSEKSYENQPVTRYCNKTSDMICKWDII